jgi:S-adenosylmethionine synthetase
MKTLIVSPLPGDDSPVEMVERKGLGHPDSICDALAETLSRQLCGYYRDVFGEVLHHNVDKALLCGGRAAPVFGGGRVISPIDIYLAGRAVAAVGDKKVPIDSIAIESARAWLRENLHALDVRHHVRLHNVVRPGSQSLGELFGRRAGRKRAMPLANDTSFGVGYAPMSPLERLVLQIEKDLNGRAREKVHPAWGEDVKVMGLRRGDAVTITIACAMIGRHLANMDEYVSETSAVRRRVRALAAVAGFRNCRIRVNAADRPAAGSVYLTVTGTSAEAGDDGEVGRGNRVNGLITPCRPMSLEAAAGKNPVSHVGKIYNVLARQIADSILSDLPEIAAAQCYLASQIGRPIDEPAIAHVRLATHGGSPVGPLEKPIAEIVNDALRHVSTLLDRYMAGQIEVY